MYNHNNAVQISHNFVLLTELRMYGYFNNMRFKLFAKFGKYAK